MDDVVGLNWRNECREGGRQTDRQMKEEKRRRKQTGGNSLADPSFHADMMLIFYLFLVSVLCSRPTPSLVSHPRSAAPDLFVPKHASHVLIVSPTFACLFVCLHLVRACVRM